MALTFEISGQKISKKDLKALGIPALAILIVLILFAFTYRGLSGKLSSEKAQLDKAKKVEDDLALKQQVLTQLQGEVLGLVGSTVLAVPEKNSALMMVSQIKSQASQRLLTISDVAIGSTLELTKGVQRIQLQFDVEGDVAQIMDFLNSLTITAPLSVLEKVNLANTGDTVRATVALSVYAAPLPSSLPSLTEPLKELSEDETNLLDTLGQLISPPFLEVTPQTPTTRTNPFE